MDGVEQHAASRELLAESLDALSSPLRLELLELLRHPIRVSDIELEVPDGERGEEARRVLSRQAVSWHLDQLLDAGLIRRIQGEGRGKLYVLDHQRLFALIDEFHGLTRLRPVAGHSPREGTLDGYESDLPEGGSRPRLVLVYGRDQGLAFEMSPEEPGPWTIGRDGGCDLQLDYDPFASGEHCRIHLKGNEATVEDLGSRNGTWVNGRKAPDQGGMSLRSGDILTVGRSRLVYQG